MITRRRELAQLAAGLAETRRDVFEGSDWADRQDEMLEHRVALLEEIVAARWPRRMLVRARLARQLRASVAGYGSWAGADWRDRRAQAVGDAWPTPAPAATSVAAASTSVAPDGSATIAAADLGTVLGALADAAMCALAHGGDQRVIPAYRRISLALGDDRG